MIGFRVIIGWIGEVVGLRVAVGRFGICLVDGFGFEVRSRFDGWVGFGFGYIVGKVVGFRVNVGWIGVYMGDGYVVEGSMREVMRVYWG